MNKNISLGAAVLIAAGFLFGNIVQAEGIECHLIDHTEEHECTYQPKGCSNLYAPVCGVDGKTYSNTCYAEMGKAEVAYEGECSNPRNTQPSPLPSPTITEQTSSNSSSNEGSSQNTQQEKSVKKVSRVAGAKHVFSNRHIYRNAPDFIPNNQVPLIVKKLFFQVYGRDISRAESIFWKMRARTDKPTQSLLLSAMKWHFEHGSTGVGKI